MINSSFLLRENTDHLETYWHSMEKKPPYLFMIKNKIFSSSTRSLSLGIIVEGCFFCFPQFFEDPSANPKLFIIFESKV